MDFECFVFEEILVSKNHRKIIHDLINRIFRSKTFVRIIKNQKIQEVSFSLVLVGNSDGKKLNYYHRNKNTIPDILSFPFWEREGNKTILGDIIITPKMLEKNYKAIKEGYQKLLIHGLLHLLGFDHIKDKDFKEMNKLENMIAGELTN